MSALCLIVPNCCITSSLPCCCIMYTHSILLRYVYLFHATSLCLLVLSCCAMSTYSLLLGYVFLFYAAALCLLIPRCCTVSTYSMHMQCVCLFYAALLYIHFLCCCDVSTFFELLYSHWSMQTHQWLLQLAGGGNFPHWSWRKR